MTAQFKADLMLLIVVFCWGFSFLATDIGIDALGPFTLNAWRFLLAFGAAVIFSGNRLRHISGATRRHALLLGVMLSLVFGTLTCGMQRTTLANAGFLCGLTVIFTPALSGLVYRQAPEPKLILVALTCLAGIALLTLTENLTLDYAHIRGDLFCMACALIYAAYLLVTEKAVAQKEVDACQLGVLQLGVTGLISLVLALALERPAFPPNTQIWVAVVFLAVICTAMAFIVQTIAQRYTSASHVGVINCFETVFAGIVAYTFGNEPITGQSVLGAACIVLGLFILEINFSGIWATGFARRHWKTDHPKNKVRQDF